MTKIIEEYKARITTYPFDVLDGNVLACENIKIACKRFVGWFDRDDMFFDVEEVERTFRFISHFKHFTGQYNNKPFLLEEWQKWMFSGIYGWKWKETKLRVTRTFLLSVSRKQGKSSALSLMAIKAMLEEPNAQCIVAANSASQASILFKMCTSYIKSLGKKTEKIFKRYRDKIIFDKTQSEIKVVSADATRLDGLNCNFAVVDEISQAPNSDVYTVLSSSMGSRRQPLMCCCTTRSHNNSGFYKELEKSALDCLRGIKNDDTIFPVVYTLDDGDDYENESVWKKCSPNLDISVSRDFYRQQITVMKNSPSQFSATMEKVFNVWTSSSNVWIPMDYVYKVMKNVDIKDYKDYLCYLSYDLASTSDLSCVTALFENDNEFVYKTWYFLPNDTLKTSVNKDKYKIWKQQGYLITTPGNVTDYDYIFNQIQKIQNETSGVMRISYDTWNSTSLAIQLTNEGYNMQPYSQSIGSMNLPTKELERMIMQGNNVIIDKNPITAWCFENAVSKSDWNDNQKIIKESYDNKIDGVISMIMGLGGWMQDNNFNGVSCETFAYN